MRETMRVSINQFPSWGCYLYYKYYAYTSWVIASKALRRCVNSKYISLVSARCVTSQFVSYQLNKPSRRLVNDMCDASRMVMANFEFFGRGSIHLSCHYCAVVDCMLLSRVSLSCKLKIHSTATYVSVQCRRITKAICCTTVSVIWITM